MKYISTFFDILRDKLFVSNRHHTDFGICGTPAMLLRKKEMKKKQIIGKWRYILQDLPDSDAGDD